MVVEETKYRPHASLLVTGASLCLLGLILLGPVVYALVTGHSVLNLATQGPNAQDNLRMMVLVGCLPLAYGVFNILRWKNGLLILDAEGVRLKNALGQECFHAKWEEITKLESRFPAGSGLVGARKSHFSLHTRRKIAFLREFGNNLEMAEQIRRSSPRLSHMEGGPQRERLRPQHPSTKP